MKLSKLKFTTQITTTYKRGWAYILVYAPTLTPSLNYPDAIPTPRVIKTHPTADRATNRIPHISHCSAV